jgi:hypothetical protein
MDSNHKFTQIENLTSDHIGYELVMELPRLKDGDGQSLSVRLYRNREGYCSLFVEHEMRGEIDALGSFDISKNQFKALTGHKLKKIN